MTVTFRLRVSPGTTATVPPPASTSAASSVSIPPVAMRGAQRVGAERLRCLHEDEIRARHRRDDVPVGDAFHGVDHRKRGDRGVGTRRAPRR